MAAGWSTVRVAVVLAVWLGLATSVAASGALTRLRPPAPQAVIFGLSVAGWMAVRRFAPLRAWSAAVDTRLFVVPHLFRALAGIAFLRMAAAGRLPADFALPAAWGDIAVAVLAALLLAAGPIRSRRHARAWVVWNVFGLADILLVVANAARVGLANPSSMAALLRLPLAVLPAFLVPVIFITHALLFVRLTPLRRRDGA
jgi:hypothetical protein